MEEFYCFVWMALIDIPQLSIAKLFLKFIVNKSVYTYDEKCLDKFINLKKLLECRNDNEELCNLLPHLKWVNYFENSTYVDCHSDYIKVTQFFFVAPSHNAHAERIFSLTTAQWTKERLIILSLPKAYCFCSIITSVLQTRNSMAASEQPTTSDEDTVYREICIGTARVETFINRSRGTR
jgi:hypothetical protein